jgi:hypothetical protein
MTKNLSLALLDHHDELKAGFENAIRIALHESIKRSAKANPEEPDIVAMLVLEGVPYIAKTLQAVIGRYGIKSTVSSVFCHQKPTVIFNRKQDSCELGDILIIHRHRGAKGRPIRNNSLLLQAKMVSQSEYKIPPQERHQLRLYESWPHFEYVRSGPRLNGYGRDIRPKARHNGAQYLLIDNQMPGTTSPALLGLPNTHCMSVWPAMNTLYTHHSLADELLRFLTGTTGREFDDDPHTDSTHWSYLIWDLLEHGQSFVFTRKNVGIAHTSRFGGDAAALTNLCMIGEGTPSDAQAFLDTMKKKLTRPEYYSYRYPPYGEIPNNAFPDDPEGISIILIETYESPDSNESGEWLNGQSLE